MTIREEIRYFGEPEMTEEGIEVMGFHLHRYLASWLERLDIERLWVTVGFEHSGCSMPTFAIERNNAEATHVGWTFDDLRHTYRHGDGRLHLESPERGEAPMVLEALPIIDRPEARQERRVIVGFLLVAEEAGGSEVLGKLQTHAFEAIAAARRNAMRLFFDEHSRESIKKFLYDLMERLPEWTGCDHSASMLLTSSLDTLTLEKAEEPQFNILAERLFYDPADEAGRLVGMSLSAGSERDNIIRAAVERQRGDAAPRFHRFVRDDDEPQLWYAPAEDTEAQQASRHEMFHRDVPRPDESMYVLVPLLSGDHEDETELLGFVCLVYREVEELPDSVGDLLGELGAHLGEVLRNSALYTLSARKLWILRRIRQVFEAHVREGARGASAVESLIGDVIDLIVEDVAVPSVAIAYRLESAASDGDDRVVRYVHAHGWEEGESLDLPIDVPPRDRIDSGVSSLAARLERPLVLAGGHGSGATFQFKNFLWVHEGQRRILDERSPEGRETIDPEEGWTPMRHYYKPVRDNAYATLAYPVLFADRALGIVSVEVVKQTDWLWWTGFGGHQFWQSVAGELAVAFHSLGV